jgi:hypothetical protein
VKAIPTAPKAEGISTNLELPASASIQDDAAKANVNSDDAPALFSNPTVVFEKRFQLWISKLYSTSKFKRMSRICNPKSKPVAVPSALNAAGSSKNNKR